MILQFSDAIKLNITAMDRTLSDTNINVIITSDDKIPIDELIEIKTINNNNFSFMIDDIEFKDYKLVHASEHYDSKSNSIISTINFTK